MADRCLPVPLGIVTSWSHRSPTGVGGWVPQKNYTSWFLRTCAEVRSDSLVSNFSKKPKWHSHENLLALFLFSIFVPLLEQPRAFELKQPCTRSEKQATLCLVGETSNLVLLTSSNLVLSSSSNLAPGLKNKQPCAFDLKPPCAL